ncbi:MAG: hypothetical protein EOO65_04495, partial [Methanosarcinales archaeon]
MASALDGCGTTMGQQSHNHNKIQLTMHVHTEQRRHNRAQEWKRAQLFLLALFVRQLAVACAQDSISTVAGSGAAGGGGDGGQATSGSLDNPFDVAAHFNAGTDEVTFFIGDSDNHRVRKVSPNGIISTIAGTGVSGYSADNVAATSSKLSMPLGVSAVWDPSTSKFVVYIADYLNNRIRRVVDGGLISTIAGNGIGVTSGDGDPAVDASVNKPYGIRAIRNSVSGGTIIFFSDGYRRCMRRINEAGIIDTIGGNCVVGSTGGDNIAFSSAYFATNGLNLFNVHASSDASAVTLWVPDRSNHRVRRVFPDSTIVTVAGTGTAGFSGDNGAALLAKLNEPVDAVGTFLTNDQTGPFVLWIADSGNNRIRHVSSTGIITTLVGPGTVGQVGDGGVLTSAYIPVPHGLQLIRPDPGQPLVRLYLVTWEDHRVRRIVTWFMSPSPTPSTSPTTTRTLSATPTKSMSSSQTRSPSRTASSTPSRTASST